jgi:hypothetical protein
MTLCASCGLPVMGDMGLCDHHHGKAGDNWAIGNRIMCDFFHRGIVPPRLATDDRDDDFWTTAPTSPELLEPVALLMASPAREEELVEA